MSTAASHPRLPVPFATQAAIRSVLRNEGDRAAELGREQRCSLTPLLCLRRGHKGRAQRSKGAPEPQGTDQGEIAPRPQSAVRITPPVWHAWQCCSSAAAGHGPGARTVPEAAAAASAAAAAVAGRRRVGYQSAHRPG